MLKHAKEVGKLRNWARLGAIEDMHSQWEEQQANRQAEDNWVRENVFGQDTATQGSGEVEDDEVRQTILGDVTITNTGADSKQSSQSDSSDSSKSQGQPLAPPQPEKASKLKPALAGAAIALGAAGIPAAGALGYMLARPSETPEVRRATDKDTISSLRLGRYEEYMDQQ